MSAGRSRGEGEAGGGQHGSSSRQEADEAEAGSIDEGSREEEGSAGDGDNAFSAGTESAAQDCRGDKEEDREGFTGQGKQRKTRGKVSTAFSTPVFNLRGNHYTTLTTRR